VGTPIGSNLHCRRGVWLDEVVSSSALTNYPLSALAATSDPNSITVDSGMDDFFGHDGEWLSCSFPDRQRHIGMVDLVRHDQGDGYLHRAAQDPFLCLYGNGRVVGSGDEAGDVHARFYSLPHTLRL